MTSPSPSGPTPPLACTLTPESYAERVAWIARLNRASLRSHRRDGPVLELRYARDAGPAVRELVRREAACCAFLEFTITEEAGVVRLRVEVPGTAEAAAGTLVAPFLAGAGADSGGRESPGDPA